MNNPPNLHFNFFSSLKQVEKRLKLETPNPPDPTHTSTESLSSPIFLYPIGQSPKPSSNLENSETPNEFFTNSIDFPQTNQDPGAETHKSHPQIEDGAGAKDRVVDDIGLLIELLGLSDCEVCDQKLDLEGCSSCRCDVGFYDKIVGVKGPKCDMEVGRLEGWVRHFGKERIEPLRMAHLMLGKAAFLACNGGGNGGGSGGFEGLEFPSTVEEFLQNDPPV